MRENGQRKVGVTYFKDQRLLGYRGPTTSLYVASASERMFYVCDKRSDNIPEVKNTKHRWWWAVNRTSLIFKYSGDTSCLTPCMRTPSNNDILTRNNLSTANGKKKSKSTGDFHLNRHFLWMSRCAEKWNRRWKNTGKFLSVRLLFQKSLQITTVYTRI